MPVCRNCGRKTKYADFCEWCHYPLVRAPWQVRKAMPLHTSVKPADLKTEQLAQYKKAREALVTAIDKKESRTVAPLVAQTLPARAMPPEQANSRESAQMNGKVKVFIIDDDRLFRRGLRPLLSQTDDIELIGESDFLEGTAMIIEALAPDVVLIDIKLPAMRGLELAQRVRQLSPHTGLLMLTPYEDDNQIFEALKAGVAGYLKKSTAPGELLNAIRRISHGEHIVDELLRRPTVARRILAYLQQQQKQGRIKPLTPEEIETLVSLTGSHSSGHPADTTNLSERLITNQAAFILSKLAASGTDAPDSGGQR
jgi:DNA-binding NarL/FixJ family response regulator